MFQYHLQNTLTWGMMNIDLFVYLSGFVISILLYRSKKILPYGILIGYYGILMLGMTLLPIIKDSLQKDPYEALSSEQREAYDAEVSRFYADLNQRYPMEHSSFSIPINITIAPFILLAAVTLLYLRERKPNKAVMPTR